MCQSVCLDNDGIGGSSENAGSAIDHLFKNLLDAVEPIAGQSHDGGGGGVGGSLQCYLASFCSLQALQLGLSHGSKATSGVGGIGLETLLQLAHSFLDLQNCLTHKE
jgi:hypothetical protein